jgi:hypothetical protein
MTEEAFAPREEPTRWDLALLFVAPSLLLIAVFLYPDSTRMLEYEARNPTLLTILGSNLAHRGIGHLVGNLLGLWLVGGLAFLLASACRCKRLYYVSFLTYLLVLPFFADALVREMLAQTPAVLATFAIVGFSQTVGALVGLLALAIGLFVHDNVDRRLSGLVISLGLFISGFAIVIVNFGTSSLALVVSLLSGTVAIGFVLGRADKALDRPLHLAASVQFIVAGLVTFYAALLMLFPTNVGGGFYGHLAGYVWGYLLPAFGLLISRTYNHLSERANVASSART